MGHKREPLTNEAILTAAIVVMVLVGVAVALLFGVVEPWAQRHLESLRNPPQTSGNR